MSTKNVKVNENAKATATTQEDSLIHDLKSILPEVIKLDDALGAKIDKALNSKKTSESTLRSLLKEAIDLGHKAMPKKKPVVETEEKPAPKKNVTAKKTTEKEEEKPAKVEKKKTEKESPVKSVKSTGDIKAPVATLFPDTLTTSFEGADITLTKAKDTEFLTVEDIVTAMNEDKIIVLACYWTKRHIKEFDYALNFSVAAPKSFKNDLDLCIAAWECPTIKRLFAMSLETEAVYYFEEESLTPVEDTNPYNGEKYNIRVSNGMEYAIYVADAPTEETSADESTED